MKKTLSFLTIVLAIVIHAQNINFTNANFKAKLLSATTSNQIAKNLSGAFTAIDTDNNGEISQIEANNINALFINSSTISDITGINNFTNLNTLSLSNCPITSLNNLQINSLQDLGVNNLSSLNGINFSGIPNLKSISLINNQMVNTFSNLDLTPILNLENLNIQYSGVSSILFGNKANLTSLQAKYTNLSSFILNNAPLLQNVDISNNSQLTSLDVSNCANLYSLYCLGNNLQTLVAQNNPILHSINCNNNQITSINNSGSNMIAFLWIGNNPISYIDFSTYPALTNIIANNNNFSQLNFSQNPNLSSVIISNAPNLTSINFKSGNAVNMQSFQTFSLSAVPNLHYICCDNGAELTYITNYLNNNNFSNVSANSYCSFVPGGTYYTIQGNTKYDQNNNGCDTFDTPILNQKFNITNGTISGAFIGNNSGNYSTLVSAGSHTITPILENPSYFTISPSTFVANFPTMTSPLTQNFCLSPNGSHNDLEVIILPITAAVPGFNPLYKILYKNKGTTTQSGSINFMYNDAISDYVSASTSPTSQSTGLLNWNFSNLLPFETRSIIVNLHLNTPTSTPPVSSGNILNYHSEIIAGIDETPTDNIFDLNQAVVNSFDPNDKTCLEGNTIAQAKVGDYVHYLIRFENTGTANAQNIVVKDVIDTSKFDISSLVSLNSSHSFTTRITNPNTVEFIFENIQLPFNDATNDGYVLFKIKTLSSLTAGNTFSNDAEIYFDYNAPIITNEYVTTVQSFLSTAEVTNSDFRIYPNPVVDVLHFEGKEKVKKLEIFDVAGRIIFAKGVEENQVNLSSLKAGNYILKIYTKNQTLSYKIMKK